MPPVLGSIRSLPESGGSPVRKRPRFERTMHGMAGYAPATTSPQLRRFALPSVLIMSSVICAILPICPYDSALSDCADTFRAVREDVRLPLLAERRIRLCLPRNGANPRPDLSHLAGLVVGGGSRPRP